MERRVTAAGVEDRPEARRLVVLVVEDDPSIRWCALEVLSGEGFEAVGAANADAAILILESRDDVAVIFTDIDMPGTMDGLRLAHAVKGRWPPIQIIVTSALQPHSVRLPAGGKYFLKPYHCHQVLEAIRELTA
jgi:CheY-like chemotaxis protein